jgi:serine/threonine-protein kinase
MPAVLQVPIASGVRIGPYEVIGAIGAGGMGEVYRATDTRLGRPVAIKVLPDAFAEDAERLARFEREAKTLAALNHPNIAALYGFEDTDDAHALVMELVEGPTLAERMAHGPMFVNEALAIARQIAGALEAAHEQGIVHRDLKPANVKVRPDGTVKVLDFGLAKALASNDASAPSGSLSHSPTITSPVMTKQGLILGTAAYMSPEQARGRPVDKRADIWAFGCVLYEMLTGNRAFGGEDLAESLGAVIHKEPDWSVLPPETSGQITRLLQWCLRKEQRDRLPHIAIARFEIDALVEQPVSVTPRSAARHGSWRRTIPIVLTAAVAAALGGWAAWHVRPTAPVTVTTFEFTHPEAQLLGGTGRHTLAVSPDGSEIAFVSTEGRLFRRSMSQLDAEPIRGTDAWGFVTNPVFSPDGRSIAFWTPSDRTLKRIALTGGAAVTLCRAENPWGMSWDSTGVTFAQGAAGILRVAEAGGTPEVLARVEPTEYAGSPQILPGGDHLLFTLVATGPTDLNRFDTARIIVQSLRTGERTTLAEGADARYLPSGHLVYAVAGSVLGAGFDVGQLRLTSPAVPVLEGIRRAPAAITGAAQFSVSATGTLVYIPGPTFVSTAASDLALTDRQGTVTPLKLPPAPYQFPRVSPDGARVAFGNDDGREATVWTYDLDGSNSPRKLTLGGKERHPIWSADSTRVTFQAEQNGSSGIFWQMADGSSPAERITTAARDEWHTPESWSSAGQLLYSVQKGSTYALWMYSATTRKAMPFGSVRSSLPTTAVFSPDGRWVAYSTREDSVNALNAIFVEPFPPTGAVFELPQSPGITVNPHHPLWSLDGKELLFVGQIGTLWSVRITTSPRFGFGIPQPVPRTFPVANPITPRTFDITPDGKTLGIIAVGQAPGPARDHIRVVLNWDQELKRLVPAR